MAPATVSIVAVDLVDQDKVGMVVGLAAVEDIRDIPDIVVEEHQEDTVHNLDMLVLG